MITFNGFDKSYGKQNLFKKLNLNIDSKKITAILGPNGSGKTTLVKAFLGLVKADQGDILYQDKSTLKNPVDFKSRIGYMPQYSSFPENLNVREIINFMQDLRSVENMDLDLITDLKLDIEYDKKISELSGGTKQKLAAAIAFMFKPEFLVLDEPYAGLDPISTVILKKKILKGRSESNGFLIITHLLNDLSDFVDEIIFLINGDLIFQGDIKKLLELTNENNVELAIAKLMVKINQ
jgi:Cu-processing system ATP-binding protein